jgi:hypothetical protein
MISLHGSLTSKIDHFDPRFLALVGTSRKLLEKDVHYQHAFAHLPESFCVV